MLSCHLGQTHASRFQPPHTKPHITSSGVMPFYVKTTSADPVPFDATSLSVNHAVTCVRESTRVQPCHVMNASSSCVIRKRNVMFLHVMPRRFLSGQLVWISVIAFISFVSLINLFDHVSYAVNLAS